MLSLPLNYLKSAVRQYRRQKISSAINLVGLAFGLAAFSMGALTAYVGFHYDDFHKNADRIFGVVQALPSATQGDQRLAVVPAPLAPALLKAYPEVEAAVRFTPSSRKIASHGDKKFNENGVYYADPGFFSFFSFAWKTGNRDTALADPNGVVLTESTAARYFGDEDPIGKTLAFAEEPSRVVSGVIRDVPFDSSIQFDMVVPFSSDQEDWLNSWRSNTVSTFIRLRPDCPPAEFEAKLPPLVASSLSGRPDSPKRLSLMALTDFFHRSPDIISPLAGNSPGELYIAIAFGVIFLLLVSVNYSSLAVAGCLGRIKEVGVRKVVGSERRHLFAQFLGESVLLALAAWVLSWPVFEVFRRGYASLFGEAQGAALTLGRHPQVWLLTAGVAILVGILSGMYPAVLLAGVRPARVLKGDFSSGKRGSRARKILVTVQFAIAIFLVLSSVAVRKQYDLLRTRDLGFNRRNVLTVSLEAESRPLIGPLRDALRRRPDIKAVGGASMLPVKAGGQSRVFPEGGNAREPWLMDDFSVDVGFVEALGLGLRDGRAFTMEDAGTGEARWILNETAVRRLGWTDPVGRRLTVDDRTGTVVGVVRDFHFTNLVFRIPPTVLRLNPNADRYLYIAAAGSGPSSELRALVEREWDALAPNLPFEARMLDFAFDEAYKDMGNVSLMLRVIGFFTIAFSCLGMIGLVSFILNARMKDIGVRKVLGASAGRIMKKLMTEFLSLVLIAAGIAMIGALLVWPRVWVLYAYSSTVPVPAYLLMTLLSLLIVGGSILGKTWSVARRNPADVLKYE